MDNDVLEYFERELRRCPRFSCPPPPAFPWLALLGPNRWLATVRNISAGGIGFASSHIYPAGFQTTIELLNVAAHTLVIKSSRVAHCTPRGGHIWILGASFVEPFTDQELKDLLR